MKEAFLIVEARAISSSEWLVKGRAYEDVKVGDTLFILIHEVSNVEAFKIVKLETYGGPVTVLNRMLTGEITLHGRNGETLLYSKILMI